MWAISLLATLGTRRCRESGDVERNGGLEDVETGVGVAEVGGGLERSPLCEIDGTLGLPAVGNFVLTETDEVGYRDGGDVDKFSTLRIFEVEATRGLDGSVRWAGAVTELGVPGSLVVGAFTWVESLVTFEVIRTGGVGLG